MTFNPRFFVWLLVGFALTFASCKNRTADLILINGFVHTMNPEGDIEQAVAILDGKIAAVGLTNDLLAEFACDSILDLKGKSVYPGFIDGHCHFVGYALGNSQVDLVGTNSWEEVVSRVDSFSRNITSEWILGRGWDQNDWNIKEFPTNQELNRLFPNRPVILKRIDGHAAIANDEALKRAKIEAGTKIGGGIVESRRGRITGILIDNAVDVVEKLIPPPSPETIANALKKAEKNLFSVGLTTVDDAGLDRDVIELIDSLQRTGELKIRVYAMANATPENLDYYLERGPFTTERINVRSFKMYADGALGSRGACLLEPYSDAPGKYGLILKPAKYYREVAERVANSQFQLNTHCIGDSANRMILRLYEKVLKADNTRRWRIEHAQVIHPADFHRFKDAGIIPSVQPTHATSDYPWVKDRIGKSRSKGAYAYKTLYEQGKTVAIGSDFPVESIDPLLGFYAAVSRKDLKGYPFSGFNPEQALSREVALYGMTAGAAYANFAEENKGSLEVGKFADLVVLDKDLLFVEEKEIPNLNVLYTIVDGEIVFSGRNP
ncbi:MAG: amidohydrolase [Bacteroidia bacterium]|nr:amidohydrolase [Bacteroidia bacterium]